jgi:hypothetical protein
VVANSGPLRLGKDPVFGGFEGLLDDVRIYAFAIGEASVRALAAGAASATPAELLATGEAAYRRTAYEALLAASAPRSRSCGWRGRRSRPRGRRLLHGSASA